MADPYTEELDELDLARLSEECGAYFRKNDPGEWVVVTATLAAQIVEKLCRSMEGGVRVPVGGVEGGAGEECSAESDGHVAIAYQIRPAVEVLGGTSAPATVAPALSTLGEESADYLDVAAAISEKHRRAAEGVAAAVVAPSLTTSGGTFTADLDVSAALAEQKCAREAEEKAAAAVRARVGGEVRKKQAEASASWSALGAQATRCLELEDVAARKRCVEKVGEFVEWAEGLRVELGAGFEAVETSCGERRVAIGAESAPVGVAEVADARDMLARLNVGPGGTVTITGDAAAVWLVGSRGTFGAGSVPAGSYVLRVSWAPGTLPVEAGSIDLEAGQNVHVNCRVSFLRCFAK